MICQRCRTGMLSRLQPQHTITWTASSPARQTLLQRTQFRNYSDGKASVSAPPPPPTPRQPVSDDITIPSAVSSATPGVSQPLSTPEGVHTDAHPAEPAEPTKPTPSKVLSSCPAGTKLNGLNYFKNKPDVVALEDSEYPEWLWGLLEEFESKANDKSGGVDPKSLNKKGRKRLEKKLAAHAASLPPKIPSHHQATDITPASYNQDDQAAGDILTQAAESLEKRGDITTSARAARRKSIREANFLRGL